MNRRIAAPVCLLAASLFVWCFGLHLFFQQSLNTLENRSSQVTSQALARVIEHAHRMSDDLTLQAALQGLAQAPGVIFACVLDNDHKILAHTEPTQMGKPFKNIARRSSQQRLSAQPLRDAAVPWGTFVLNVSQRSRQQKAAQHLLLLGLGMTLLLLSLIWLVTLWSKWLRQKDEQIESLTFRCEDLNNRLLRLTQEQRDARSSANHWIQSALNRIPEPVIMLDANQRVVACNELAWPHLQPSDPHSLNGQSWQEVPVLNQSGETLQKSLESPGMPIAAPSLSARLEFLTEAAGDSVNTWVFFR